MTAATVRSVISYHDGNSSPDFTATSEVSRGKEGGEEEGGRKMDIEGIIDKVEMDAWIGKGRRRRDE